MSAHRWLCLVILSLACNGVWPWYEGAFRRNRYGHIQQMVSYSRDWDIDWVETQRRLRTQPESKPTYEYQADRGPQAPVLYPRLIELPNTRRVRHPQHHKRSYRPPPPPPTTVRGTNAKKFPVKFQKSAISSNATDRQARKRRKLKKHKKKIKGPRKVVSRKHKVCARCPPDRIVVAKKGTKSVLMEAFTIVPCYPWSSIHKVKQKIVAGPLPGSEIPEGSHKIVTELYHRRRTIATCITRYKVIVRKCQELEVGPEVRTNCTLGRAWGARCTLFCEPGNELEGNPNTECTDDLEWSGDMPQCVPTFSCTIPFNPDNGYLSCRTPHHQPSKEKGMLPDGSVCHYHCDEGYMVPPAQQNLTKVRCVAGSWDSDQDPTCVETNAITEEEPTEITAAEALRFDGGGCPLDFCQNMGRCILILNEPMCSCLPGYSGLTCEDQEVVTEPEEPNLVN